MKVVIDIPNWLYNAIMECKEPQYSKSLGDAVRDGTPLPRSHGRLLILSEDVVKREQTTLGLSCQSWIGDVGLSNATVAIIETDKESHDEK